jgi:hypothetical protein
MAELQMSEIWYRDLNAWVRNRCTFFPTTQMHLREQMNAVVRFAPDSIALTLVTRRVGTMRIFVAKWRPSSVSVSLTSAYLRRAAFSGRARDSAGDRDGQLARVMKRSVLSFTIWKRSP